MSADRYIAISSNLCAILFVNFILNLFVILSGWKLMASDGCNVDEIILKLCNDAAGLLLYSVVDNLNID
jgi:hypothetical protein